MGLCRALVYVTAGLAASGTIGATLTAGGAALCYLIGLTYIAKQEVSGRLANLWPLALLSAPLWFALLYPEGGATEAILSAALVFWVFCALSFLRPPSPEIGTAVGMLIAGISLVDAIFISTQQQPLLAGVAIGCFAAALCCQLWVAGTLTLRPEFEVGPGGLKDGFVMVSGLGPSWSASGVATLRWRLAGRAG